MIAPDNLLGLLQILIPDGNVQLVQRLVAAVPRVDVVLRRRRRRRDRDRTPDLRVRAEPSLVTRRPGRRDDRAPAETRTLERCRSILRSVTVRTFSFGHKIKNLFHFLPSQNIFRSWVPSVHFARLVFRAEQMDQQN